MRRIAKRAGVGAEAVLGSDLFVTPSEAGLIWGPEGEFLSSPHLDDQECVFGSFAGFLKAADEGAAEQAVLVHAVFDNEEVGSGTRQGAHSTLLRDVIGRIALKTGMDEEERQMAVDRLEEQMLAAAANLDFERAAKLRDQMLALKGEKVMGTEEKSRFAKRRRTRERSTHRNPG